MKTKHLLIFLLLFFSTISKGTEILGNWNGLLKVGPIQLRLVFHVSEINNVFSTIMDSPDQGVKGIQMSKTTIDNQLITIELASARIQYIGTIRNTDTINGTFNQGGQSFPLTLTRNEIEKKDIKRPQNPQLPYPYYEEEVIFFNQKDSIKLVGTLTLPSKNGKFPVAVLISGSGPQNRDEELMGHKPFLVIADYLTRNGIGVLRYDDRGCYKSTGNFTNATTNDFATDVEAAIDYLKMRKDVDFDKIGLIGHSEGGIIAPIVASNNINVSFIVLMAGTAIPGNELLLLQQNLIGKAMGATNDELIFSAKLNNSIFNLVKENMNSDTLKSKISGYITKQLNEHSTTKLTAGKTINEYIEIQLAQLMTPWMLNFIRYNPAPTLELVKCPVLAINGSKDLQVSSNVNLAAIEKAMKKGGNKKYTIIELKGQNHLFQECKTGLPTEYPEIEQTIAPLTLKIIKDWIVKTTNTK